MRSSMGIIIAALILAALSAVMTIIGPDKIGQIATLMSDRLTGSIDLAAIAKIGIFLAVIYALSAVFSFIQHYTMAVVTLKMSYRMRGELSDKINKVPQKYFNTTSQGDILSRITNDVSTLQQGLTNSLPMIISAATQFVGCLIMMFVTEWHLALVSVGVTLVGMLLVVLIMSKSQRFFFARQKSLGELNGYVEEMYSGHEVVRISRAGRKIGAQFDRLNSAVYRCKLEIAVPLRHHAAADEYYRQHCLCRRLRVRFDPCHKRHDRVWRDRFLYPLCPVVHLSADTDGAGAYQYADGFGLCSPYF